MTTTTTRRTISADRRGWCCVPRRLTSRTDQALRCRPGCGTGLRGNRCLLAWPRGGCLQAGREPLTGAEPTGAMNAAWSAAPARHGWPAGPCKVFCLRLLRCDPHEHGLYGVVAVAVPVPRGVAGLGAAGEVGGPGADGVGARLGERGELPPLPAVPVAVADHAGLLPGALVDADLDPGDGRRA